MRRLAVLWVVIGLLVPAPAALAQSNPFGPLPPSAPAETPAPTPAPGTQGDELSRGTLALIGLAVLVIFIGLGLAITRDARRNLTQEDREALERAGAGAGTRRSRSAAKAKARQKAKAQRRARRRARR